MKLYFGIPLFIGVVQILLTESASIKKRQASVNPRPWWNGFYSLRGGSNASSSSSRQRNNNNRNNFNTNNNFNNGRSSNRNDDNDYEDYDYRDRDLSITNPRKHSQNVAAVDIPKQDVPVEETETPEKVDTEKNQNGTSLKTNSVHVTVTSEAPSKPMDGNMLDKLPRWKSTIPFLG